MDTPKTTTTKTVLLVDDDEDFLTQTRLQLEAAGYRVLPADGLPAAEVALGTGMPDLAILDLMMEHTDDGFVLAHELRKLKPTLPIILVTGVTRETGFEFSTDTEEARAWIKADAILDKPVRFEQLQREIHRLLKD
jgi:CheY-like chemotaxis protein